MTITATNFRDKAINKVTFGYDWNSLKNYVLIHLLDSDKSIKSYKISGLTEYRVYEDFQAKYIEQCTLIYNETDVYLCLDPQKEGTKEKDNDNYYFCGESIASA